jgi:hypothetical protein
MTSATEIIINTKLIKSLSVLGFLHIDFLTIGFMLSSLDQANCLVLTETEIAKILIISHRTVMRTMTKLKTFGVIKNGGRYDFSKFLTTLGTLEKTIDNSDKG